MSTAATRSARALEREDAELSVQLAKTIKRWCDVVWPPELTTTAMATAARYRVMDFDLGDATSYGEEGKQDGDVRQLTGSTRAVTASPEEVGGDGNRR